MTIIRNNGGGRFLFEALPHYFPDGYLTEIEQLVWSFYYKELEDQRKK